MFLKDAIENRTAKICIIGLGYVGLPTAIFFAESGYYVIGVDIDQDKVDKIMGKVPMFEDIGIYDRLVNVVDSGKVVATVDGTEAVSSSDIVIITVPTPITTTKEPDLSYIISAGEVISSGLKNGQLVILESTTYPGTTEEVLKPILEKTGLMAGTDFGLAYCPERYNPGDDVHTINKVARIVGAINTKWAELTKQLYQTIIQTDIVIVKNLKTAEAAKIVENIQRDLNIALMNEFSLIFERIGIDVMDVLDAASTKWNFVSYKPGLGVGGHCLPVDPYYLTHKAKELGYYPKLILAGRSINDYMPDHVVKLIIDGLNIAGKCINGAKIAILGLSYKANTGDIRESPAIKVAKKLIEMKADVRVYEPMANDSEIISTIGIARSEFDSAMEKRDCVALLVPHDNILKRLSLDEMEKLVKKDCVILDTQHFFVAEDVRERGMVYRAIGGVNK